MTGPRRKARIIVLKTLYEVDSSSHSPDEVVARLLQETALPDEASDFARSLVIGIIQNNQDIDDMIRRFAPAFPVQQIATIDRNILRLAIFEVLFDNRVPVKVAINEAVELAKSFGSEASPKFVNGVLGAVVNAHVQQGKGQEPSEETKQA